MSGFPISPEFAEAADSKHVCSVKLFGDLDAYLPEHSQAHCDQVEYNPGDIIYREGQYGHYLQAPCRGLIKLDQKLPDGTTRTLRLLQSGCVFGLELLSGERFQHSAISVTRSRVCRVPAHLISELAVSQPHIHQALMTQWQASLDEADFVIAQLSTGPARQRVARLLLHLANAQGTDVCQAPPRDDMASLMGLTPETISRTIAAFKRAGLISERGGAFTCDMARLKDISSDNECAPPERPSRAF